MKWEPTFTEVHTLTLEVSNEEKWQLKDAISARISQLAAVKRDTFQDLNLLNSLEGRIENLHKILKQI